MNDPRLLKCETCGVPWADHTVECVRHAYQPRKCVNCNWSGVYAECPMPFGFPRCPQCGHVAAIHVPDVEVSTHD
jgi:ribosomal protein L32